MAAGLITAFILPLVGVIIGIVLLAKNNNAGLWCILFSIASMVVWYWFVFSASGTSEYGY